MQRQFGNTMHFQFYLMLLNFIYFSKDNQAI